MLRSRGEVGELRYGRKGVWERFNGRRWAPAAYTADRGQLLDPTPPWTRPARSPEERARLLDQVVDEEVLGGATVLLRRPHDVLVAYQRPVSHGLHGVLTILTGGLWGIVWVVMVLARSQDRVRLEMDPQGHVWVHQPR